MSESRKICLLEGPVLFEKYALCVAGFSPDLQDYAGLTGYLVNPVQIVGILSIPLVAGVRF
jgi:hypothetical protein